MENSFKYNEEKTRLLKLTETVNYKLALLLEFLNEEFLPISKVFKIYSREEDLKADNNSEEVIFYKQIRARIITNLQYHDIIHQRIEHVIKVNSYICNELLSLNTPENCNELVMVPNLDRIALLNSEQITSIAAEYREVSNKVRHDLSLLQYYIAKVSAISLDLTDFFTNTAYFDKLMKDLGQHFFMMENGCFICLTGDDKKDEKWFRAVDLINNSYTMQSERDVLISCFPEVKQNIPVADNDEEIFF
jgi:hypothetical protein